VKIVQTGVLNNVFTPWLADRQPVG